MTTNKPGSVNQQPLYGCKGCYEDYSWPAGDLRVHEGECWCDLCWGERRWELPDQPYWDDLEPYTPAEQQPDVTQLVEALELARDRIGSERRSGEWDPLLRDIDSALAAYRQGGGE